MIQNPNPNLDQQQN